MCILGPPINFFSCSYLQEIVLSASFSMKSRLRMGTVSILSSAIVGILLAGD